VGQQQAAPSVDEERGFVLFGGRFGGRFVPKVYAADISVLLA
jgi:hypothetical protein